MRVIIAASQIDSILLSSAQIKRFSLQQLESKQNSDSRSQDEGAAGRHPCAHGEYAAAARTVSGL